MRWLCTYGPRAMIMPASSNRFSSPMKGDGNGGRQWFRVLTTLHEGRGRRGEKRSTSWHGGRQDMQVGSRGSLRSAPIAKCTESSVFAGSCQQGQGQGQSAGTTPQQANSPGEVRILNDYHEPGALEDL